MEVICSEEQGYLDEVSLPRQNFKIKHRNMRPAFSWVEFYSLWKAADQWVEAYRNPKYLHTRELLRDYIHVLTNSGMRVGEANNLRFADVNQTVDSEGRRIYRLMVHGKTGERSAILRAHASGYIDRILQQRKGAKPNDFVFCMVDGRQVKALADQFDKVLKLAGMKENTHGKSYSLYSLRYYDACDALRRNMCSLVLAKTWELALL